MCTKFWTPNHKGRGYFKEVGTDGRIILKRIFMKTGFDDLIIGFCKHGN
jgi:hypothetical protein